MFETWKYDNNSNRDERIDFIRGVVMIFLIVVHIDYFSVYNLIAWERIGLVTGAEGFVLLSGLVLGSVNKRRVEKEGYLSMSKKTWDRSFQLYIVSILAILSMPLLNLLPFINAHDVMTFTVRNTDTIYNLYPHNWGNVIGSFTNILLLKHGPHQIQVLGLYILLIAFTPLAFYFLHIGKTKILLLISFILYLYSTTYYPVRPTGAQFEYAFPILSWQLLFFSGLAMGYHKEKILDFFYSSKGIYAIIVAFIFFILGLLFTYNNPHPEFPEFMRLGWISDQDFYRYYELYFKKSTVGIGRLINDFAVLIVGFVLLTLFWQPVKKYLGWYFIPIGQASLYVFIMHVYFCLLIGNFEMIDNFWIPTLVHTLVFVGLWIMVKKEILYNIVPR